MPRVDALTRLLNAQALTGNAKSDILNLKAVRDLAVGVPIYFYCHVVSATLNDSSGTDATATLKFETDDAEAFGSGVLRQTIGVFAHGNAVGTVLKVAVDPSVLIEQWVRVDIAVANGPFDAGALTGYFTPDPSLYTAYATPLGPTV